MRQALAFCHRIDVLNEWVGKGVCFLLLPMIVFTMLEVVLRYFVNKPTIWVWDTNIQLMGVIIALTAGYTLLYKGHVIVDILVMRFSERARAIVDLATATIFLFGMGTLLWMASTEAAASVAKQEHFTSIWMPPLYPLRVVVAIGFALLLLQGISKIIRDIDIARRPGVRQAAERSQA